MTIDILIEALEMLKSHGDHPDYKAKEIQSSITELRVLKHNTPEYIKELEHGEIYPIGVMSGHDIVNILMYEEYNKIMHEKGRVDFAYFLQRTRATYGLEVVPVNMIRNGYDYISDLWQDNNADGYNEEALFANKLAKYIDWHNRILESDESLEKFAKYSYKLSFAGKEIEVPFHADTWDAIDTLLRAAREI